MLRLQGASLSVRGVAGSTGVTFDLVAELRETDAGLSERQEEQIDLAIIKARLNLTFEDFDASVCVDGVTLQFNGSEFPALVHVYLHAGQGSSLTRVGPTGAGKSTLSAVILRVPKPDTGRVTIDGIILIAAMTSWPGAIAHVPQEVAKVNGSICENVFLEADVSISAFLVDSTRSTFRILIASDIGMARVPKIWRIVCVDVSPQRIV